MKLIEPKHGGGAWYREAQPFSGYGDTDMMYRDYVQLSGFGAVPMSAYTEPMPRFGAISSQPTGMEIPGWTPSGGWGNIYSAQRQMTIPGYDPEESDIPGYWRGLGFAQGTVDAIQEKSETPAVQTGWLDVLKQAMVSATGAYTSHLTYTTDRATIRRGVPPLPNLVATPISTGYTPPRTLPAVAKPMNWGLIAGLGAAGVAALLVLPKLLKR